MSQRFYSNGKLMLTGEYLVLDGAMALALPTKFGQDLVIKEASDKKIYWKSHDADGSVWFEDVIGFDVISDTGYKEKSDSIRNTLIEILHESYLLNPTFIDNADGYKITTNLTFSKKWGLGTSSTLINNIAQWLSIDAFALLQNSFGGSGYDIACAQNNQPVLYRLENGNPIVEAVDFRPEFISNLYFVYLNKKQSSKAAINSYYRHRDDITKNVSAVNKITAAIRQTTSLGDFARQLEKHEAIMSDVLHMVTVKEHLFPDFNGTIKSLGAWGGDFILVISKNDPTPYFIDKGYDTIIPYSDMIL
ncbi:GYDIA family GHMP kinase [Flavobacterium pallidum]|uniref:GHMP kinase n=1 Tax=Flavobacterium pallidum TaxID=2172098 RepID=A0A2S1SGC5_9FLAO|nr:GYDIA family GHMP kinase [Flavobacterium pallidum]AWI25458.1 GHMP kinase [Flavobacterium pallidum]